MESRTLLFVILSVGAVAFFACALYLNIPYLGATLRQLAGPFFAERITPEEIKSKYSDGRLKILIVPGHDNDSFGAEYRGLKEADLNKDLGHELFGALKNDRKFETYITREKSGNYSDWFSRYLNVGKNEIKNFREDQKRQMQEAVGAGNVTEETTVAHNSANDNDSLKLYAINKWANENAVEIVLHIHFNDYPGRRPWQPGEYSGFSVYIPEKQLPNHRASSELATSLKGQLEKYFSKSDLPAESSALIEDQELIAIGSNASRDGVSVLVEYGYIYEPAFTNAELRETMFKELAHQTYIGVKSFFDGSFSDEHRQNDTTLLPHQWATPIKKGAVSKDTLHLQMALSKEGSYPPPSMESADCPINGVFGQCTFLAVKNFQEKYEEEILREGDKILKPTGFVGSNTLRKLNELYGK